MLIAAQQSVATTCEALCPLGALRFVCSTVSMFRPQQADVMRPDDIANIHAAESETDSVDLTGPSPNDLDPHFHPSDNWDTSATSIVKFVRLALPWPSLCQLVLRQSADQVPLMPCVAPSGRHRVKNELSYLALPFCCSGSSRKQVRVV
jgi:hypothetical protein